MPLFTIIIQDDSDDILIDQIVATSAKKAVVQWAKTLDIKKWPGIGNKIKASLIRDLEDKDNSCVVVNERTNMWCTGTLTKGKYFLFHIVKTEKN